MASRNFVPGGKRRGRQSPTPTPTPGPGFQIQRQTPVVGTRTANYNPPSRPEQRISGRAGVQGQGGGVGEGFLKMAREFLAPEPGVPRGQLSGAVRGLQQRGLPGQAGRWGQGAGGMGTGGFFDALDAVVSGLGAFVLPGTQNFTPPTPRDRGAGGAWEACLDDLAGRGLPDYFSLLEQGMGAGGGGGGGGLNFGGFGGGGSP